MAPTPICHACGKAVQGPYVQFQGTVWHAEHLLCAGCGSRLAANEVVAYAGQPYHSASVRRTPRKVCVYCRQPLRQSYLRDYWGNDFCPRHRDEYPQCCFCGRLVPPSATVRPLERTSPVCLTCRARSIFRPRQALPHFRRLLQWASDQGLQYGGLPLRVELRSAAQLADFIGRTSPDALGGTLVKVSTRLGKVIDTRVEGVSLLRGLPIPLFDGVVVHEIGHVWLVVHGVTQLPRWAEEGFCQLLSHRYYHQLNSAEARFYCRDIEERSDALYGDGFRRIQAVTGQVGFSKLIRYLLETHQIPASSTGGMANGATSVR